MVADSRAPRWVLLPLRLYLGAAFLRAAITGKLGEYWQPWPGWMEGVIHDRLPRSFPLYREFLSGVVLPHVALFAHAVAVGEVVVGALLLCGLATRAAALGGLFLAANYLLLNGPAQLVPSHETIFMFGSNDPVFLLSCLALYLGAAGRTLGADQLLHKRFPELPIS